jgi:hypothetical protein
LIGHTYEALMRRALAAGHIFGAQGCEESWLRQRMAAHGQMDGLQICQTSDGRWIQFHKIRTSSGSFVMERNEVTSLMANKMALVQSKENLAHLSTTDPLTGTLWRRGVFAAVAWHQ